MAKRNKISKSKGRKKSEVAKKARKPKVAKKKKKKTNTEIDDGVDRLDVPPPSPFSS